MAVPLDTTVTNVVTQALKRGGRTNPTATQIQEATDNALQEVKADIMLVAETHSSLLAMATTVVTKGQQRYSVPSDYNIPYSISLLDGSDDLKGAVQSAAASSIILASGVSIAPNDIIGKYILITSGPGIEEYKEVIDYDTSTRLATLELEWDVIPTATSTYMIVQQTRKLWPSETSEDLDTILTPYSLGTPRLAAVFAQEYHLYPVPDKSTYGLQSRYWADLSKVDEAGPLFLQLLREWRNIWIQGIAVKTMQRFDEDRYLSEMSIYNHMLEALSSKAANVGTVRFNDI